MVWLLLCPPLVVTVCDKLAFALALGKYNNLGLVFLPLLTTVVCKSLVIMHFSFGFWIDVRRLAKLKKLLQLSMFFHDVTVGKHREKSRGASLFSPSDNFSRCCYTVCTQHFKEKSGRDAWSFFWWFTPFLLQIKSEWDPQFPRGKNF